MTCVHHWKIAALAVDGAFPATCKHCGASRDYPTEYADKWGRPPPSNGPRRRSRAATIGDDHADE